LTTGAERRALAAQFGRNLKSEREKANLSVYELSGLAEVDWRAVEKTEQGKRLPRLGPAQRLARSLGVELDALIDGIEWRAPEGAFFVRGERVG